MQDQAILNQVEQHLKDRQYNEARKLLEQLPADNEIAQTLLAGMRGRRFRDGAKGIGSQVVEQGVSVPDALKTLFTGFSILNTLTYIMMGFIPLIGQVVALGYMVRAARGVMEESQHLPDWRWHNVRGDVMRGLVVLLGLLIYSLPLLVVLILTQLSPVGYLFITGEQASTVGTLISAAINILLFAMVYLLIVFPVASAAIARYGATGRASAFYNIIARLGDLVRRPRALLDYYANTAVFSIIMFILIAGGLDLFDGNRTVYVGTVLGIIFSSVYFLTMGVVSGQFGSEIGVELLPFDEAFPNRRAADNANADEGEEAPQTPAAE